jgi:rhomboid family GlyGly-CTERM serine protease
MNKNIIFILFAIILCSIAQLTLRLEVDWLQYSRADIAAGQWWRFVTGNIVHLSWRHFLMNIVGLIAIIILFPNRLKLLTLILILISCSLSVTIGMWVFSPDVQWYVGASGALHGLLVALILIEFISDEPWSMHWLNIMLLVAIMLKLTWELFMGPIPGSESTAGGPVIVQAHLYGFMGGLLCAGYIIIKNNVLDK